MIEIISRPKMKKCENCGCEFTYEKEDTIRHTIKDITNPHYGYISVDIKCPQCDNKIYLGEEVDLELRREKRDYDYDAYSKRRNKLEGVFNILW